MITLGRRVSSSFITAYTLDRDFKKRHSNTPRATKVRHWTPIFTAFLRTVAHPFSFYLSRSLNCLFRHNPIGAGIFRRCRKSFGFRAQRILPEGIPGSGEQRQHSWLFVGERGRKCYHRTRHGIYGDVHGRCQIFLPGLRHAQVQPRYLIVRSASQTLLP